MEYSDKDTREFWEAMKVRDYRKAIYHISPDVWYNYLAVTENQLSAEERHALEASMRSQLASALDWQGPGPSPGPDFALIHLSKWFGIVLRPTVFDGPRTELEKQNEKRDAPKVEILRAIFNERGLTLEDKIELGLRIGSIKRESPFGWGECKVVAQTLAPHGFSFQPSLERWCEEMYRSYKQSSLGGSR